MNLDTHRQQESVWARPGWDGLSDRKTAVRIIAGVGGGVLAIQGLRRGHWSGRVMISIGTSLAWWALTGGGKIGAAQHWIGQAAEKAGLTHRTRDAVQEASDESFPASDAPSWTPTMASGVRRSPVVQ